VGMIARLLSFITGGVTASRVDAGGGDITEIPHFSAPGDDSHPLPDDYVAVIRTRGTGRSAAIGYVDGANAQQAAAGEKRIYARDSGGTVVVEVWLKNDGTATIKNDGGEFTLNPDGTGDFTGGDFTINGATITAAGDVKSALGISLNTHTHVGNLGVNTSPPLP